MPHKFLVHMQVTRCLMAHRALIAPLWPLSWEISRSHCVIVTVINPLSRDWSCRVHYRYFLFQPVIAMALLDQFLKRNSNPRLLHKKIEQNPLKSLACDSKPVYAVITNCTYDGMCYNAQQAQDLLAKSVDQIHFDEAWYAYARFNPLYRDRFAMRGDPADHDALGPTILLHNQRINYWQHCRKLLISM